MSSHCWHPYTTPRGSCTDVHLKRSYSRILSVLY